MSLKYIGILVFYPSHYDEQYWYVNYPFKVYNDWLSFSCQSPKPCPNPRGSVMLDHVSHAPFSVARPRKIRAVVKQCLYYYFVSFFDVAHLYCRKYVQMLGGDRTGKCWNKIVMYAHLHCLWI